jgi:threonine/homoserine/homoserine lactone efflux protein
MAPRSPTPVQLSAAEQKRRRARSIAIGLALGFMVLLFYIVTIAKLGPQVLNRPL